MLCSCQPVVKRVLGAKGQPQQCTVGNREGLADEEGSKSCIAPERDAVDFIIDLMWKLGKFGCVIRMRVHVFLTKKSWVGEFDCEGSSDVGL